MTPGALIEYLKANGCHIYHENSRYLKMRKDGTSGSEAMSGVPLFGQGKDGHMRPVTICSICQCLQVAVPEEVKHAEEMTSLIKKKFPEE